METEDTKQKVEQPAPLERVPTGIAGIDTILRGGLLRGGMYLIAGAPGTGKTILGNQFCFNHTAAGGRAVYVTLITETHTRMLAHIQSLGFFNPAVIGGTLNYFSGYNVLEQHGLDGLLTFVRQVINAQQATMLVIEGLSTVAATSGNDLAFKRFLQGLQAFSEIRRCTTLLLSHNTSSAADAEHVMVDGLIALSNRQMGLREIREMMVWKLRGSNYIEGRHHFVISDAGIVVYPRTEAVYGLSDTQGHDSEERMTFGIPRLDAMLDGGVPANSSTMLFGVVGSGKTSLLLHFLASGAALQQPGLYFGFNETPDRLLRKSDQIGLNLRPYVSQSLLAFSWHAPNENIPDALVQHLFATIERLGVRRLVIDGLGGFLKTILYPERIEGFVAALMNELRVRGITTLFSMEMRNVTGAEIIIPAIGVSETTDNMICLRFVELRAELHRLISIMKTRDSTYDASIREFKITPQGIQVEQTFDNVQGLLTGTARFEQPNDGGEPPSIRTSDVE